MVLRKLVAALEYKRGKLDSEPKDKTSKENSGDNSADKDKNARKAKRSPLWGNEFLAKGISRGESGITRKKVLGGGIFSNFFLPTADIVWVGIAPTVLLAESIANGGNFLVDIAVWVIGRGIGELLGFFEGGFSFAHVLIFEIERASTKNN